MKSERITLSVWNWWLGIEVACLDSTWGPITNQSFGFIHKKFGFSVLLTKVRNPNRDSMLFSDMKIPAKVCLWIFLLKYCDGLLCSQRFSKVAVRLTEKTTCERENNSLSESKSDLFSLKSVYKYPLTISTHCRHVNYHAREPTKVPSHNHHASLDDLIKSSHTSSV